MTHRRPQDDPATHARYLEGVTTMCRRISADCADLAEIAETLQAASRARHGLGPGLPPGVEAAARARLYGEGGGCS